MCCINKSKIDYFWTFIKMLVVSIFIVFIVRGFVFIPLEVIGNSMENTLLEKDFIAYERFTTISRFDIVVFTLPNGDTYIKRIIGLPGENIKFEDDQLYVNDRIISEPFLEKNKSEKNDLISYTNDFELSEVIGQTKLNSNEYFVLGDNRRLSKDSRSFGAIKLDYIDGKARVVYFPLSRFKLI